MTSILTNASVLTESVSVSDTPLSSNMTELATLWARKYIKSLANNKANGTSLRGREGLSEVASKEGRLRTASRLLGHLNFASAQAWSKTEAFLTDEIQRHGIQQELIDPWQIAQDIRWLYEKAMHVYGDRCTAQRLSVVIGKEIGQVRRRYTEIDPRILGFLSMQFHYTGQNLLESLSLLERSMFRAYVKVMDDHLYMPLEQAYKAAAQHSIDAPPLKAVQKLLPLTSQIAQTVCQQVCASNPGYVSYSGELASVKVQTSSLRDVEMFQVYLCLCVLSNSIESVQQELFPLCLMLYPRLHVSWHLVQQMLQTLQRQFYDRLTSEHILIFKPYLQAFIDIFSPEVLQELS